MTRKTSHLAARYKFYNALERILLTSLQIFDFSFEEEDSIEGMKRLIIDEVNTFRAEVRAQARAAGSVRRQDR